MRHHPLLHSCLVMVLAACPADDGDGDAADTGSDDASTAAATDPSTSSGSLDASMSTSESADSTGDDPFAGCDRGTLEPDLMGSDAMGNPIPLVWMGPGVDPQTGMLIDDGGTYVVSSTYLAMRPEPAAQQAFGESTAPLVPELFANPGMVALQLGVSGTCASARTLTVWRDEAAMMAFVVGDAHTAAIGRIAEISRGTSVVTHWTGASIGEVTWEVALEHVLADEGPIY